MYVLILLVWNIKIIYSAKVFCSVIVLYTESSPVSYIIEICTLKTIHKDSLEKYIQKMFLSLPHPLLLYINRLAL